MTTNLTAPASIPPAKTPYEGDVFSRKDFGDRLLTLVTKLQQGTIAIDANWGEGKTWFADEWMLDIGKTHTVIKLDAFAHDYLEDPFTLISGELIRLTQQDADLKTRMSISAGRIAKTLLPFLAKTLFNFSAKVFIGKSDFANEIKELMTELSSGGADATESFLASSFQDFEDQSKSVEEFKIVLEEFVAKQINKPVIIIIDELDRCRPNFAVALLERLKHFFSVKGIVFVLTLNRSQLEKSICGVYGELTDASAYLYKFVDLFTALPKRRETSINFARVFALERIKALNIDLATRSKVLNTLVGLASVMDFSLRDIDRALLLLRLQDLSDDTIVKTYLTCLKIKHPNIFNHVKAADVESAQMAVANVFSRPHFTNLLSGEEKEIVTALSYANYSIKQANTNGYESYLMFLLGTPTIPLAKFALICEGIDFSQLA